MAATYPDCYYCQSYRLRTEFGHEYCVDQRPCHTRWGYVPANCITCSDNHRVWEPMSQMMFGWWLSLSMNCRRLGGNDLWAYREAFTSLFEVLLDTGSEAGSRSSDFSPLSHGRGSHFAVSLPHGRSPAWSPASSSRLWGRRDRRSVGFRLRASSPRCSRPPFALSLF